MVIYSQKQNDGLNLIPIKIICISRDKTHIGVAKVTMG